MFFLLRFTHSLFVKNKTLTSLSISHPSSSSSNSHLWFIHHPHRFGRHEAWFFLFFFSFSFFLSVMEKRGQTEGEEVKELLQNEDYRLTCFYSLKVLLHKLVYWRKEKEEWCELGISKQITKEGEWKRREEVYYIIMEWIFF